MTCNSLSPKRLHLKEPTGWFAAGASFQKALTLLSDGAFKLFAYLCLKADRHTAFFQASRTELTLALGKSSDAISAYIGELDEKGVCFVHATNDSPGATTFQIREGYWPYQMVTTSPERDQSSREPFEQSAYVASVRDSFLALGWPLARSFERKLGSLPRTEGIVPNRANQRLEKRNENPTIKRLSKSTLIRLEGDDFYRWLLGDDWTIYGNQANAKRKTR